MSRSHAPHAQERSHSSGENEASASRFLALAQASADVFWWLSPSGEMRDACSGWHTFTGQPAKRSLGRGWLDAVHPADQPQIEGLLKNACTSGQHADMECHLRRGDGAYRLIGLRVIPVRMRDGAIRVMVVSGTDITRKAQAGHMSDAQMQLAVQAGRVGMWDRDLVTNEPVWTDQEKALFGWSPETPVTPERFLEAIHPEDRERVERGLSQSVAECIEHATEYRTCWPDGSLHWVTDRARANYD